jgi:hypothetical protein
LPTGVEVRYLTAPAERKAWTTMSGVAGASTIDSTGQVQVKLDQSSITETVVDVFGRTVSEANLLTGASTQFIYGDPRTDSPTTIKQRVVHSTADPSQERESRFQYDSSGRALWQKTNLLAATTTSYDQLGNVAWATTLNDKAATSHYKTLPNGQVANVTEFYLDGLGSLSLFVTSFEYDESGRILRTIDPLMGTSYSNGAVIDQELNTTPAEVIYERNGPLTRITSKAREGAESVVWQNSLGQTLKSMSPLGAKTTFKYDVRGQLISSELIPSETSTNNSDPGAKGYKTNNVFDALGRLRSTSVTSGGSVLQSSYTDYLPPGAAWTVVATDGTTGLSTASKMDSLGQTVAILGASGSGSTNPTFPSTLSLLSYTYDGSSGKTTTVHTNTIGSELTSSTTMSAPSTPNNYTYLLEEKHVTNSSGDLLSSEVKHGQNDYQPVQSLVYDLAGRPVSQTQYGVTTTLAYDSSKSGSDQVWSSSTVGVDPTYRRYDSRGQQTWVSDSLDFNSPDTIRWSYDALGRVTSESVVNGIQEVPRLWTYEGNTVVYTNRNGWVTTTTTDIDNKQIQETSTHPTNGPQNTPLTFSQVTQLYSTGSIAGLSNKEGTTQLADYQYQYDALGRVRNQTSELGMVSGKTLSFDYVYGTYDTSAKTWETTRTIKENGTELLTTKNIANALGQVTKIRETATPASKLNSKSVDFLFNGGMLEEIKRYNNGAGTGAAVSNTPIKYNANRKVSEITHYANGIADNVSKQEIRYTANGQIQDVSNQEGSNPKRTLTHTRNQDGSVGKVSTSIAGTTAAQDEKATIYNSDAMVSGKKDALGRIKEDGNGRYLYDAEGNVIEHQRFKTPGNGTMKIASSSSYRVGDPDLIYNTYLEKQNAPTGIGQGNYRLYLTPLRIESPVPLADVRITIKVVESIPYAIDSDLISNTYTIPVVKIAENTYAVVEPETWDLTIPSAQHDFYFQFKLELNVTEIEASFRVFGSLSLDRYDVKHVYQYDAKNRIIEARQVATGNIDPATLSTTHYKYDALGQMISRKVELPNNDPKESAYIYQHGNQVLEYDSANRLERASLYAQNLDLLLATDDLDFESNGSASSAETVWVLSDYQGTVTGLYVSEDRFDRVAYDEYGRPLENTSHALDESILNEIVRFGYIGMYYDIDTYLYLDGTRPYDAASGRYFTSSSLASGVNFVYSFAGNTPVDRTTAAVNHNSNSTVPSWGSVFAEQFAENIDPRVFGFAQAAFGISEMLVGTAFAWTGVGLLVTANGADDTWAGIATMYYGEHVHTLKYRALYAATGSETVATIGEIGAGLASGAAVSRLNHLAKLAKQAQQASNVGEAVVRTADNAVETLANSADNFAVSAASQSPVKRFELPTIQSWCFAPDTLVDTPQGKRRIDEIRENDLVFAFDFTSGQWVERPVEVCHRNLYQGSLIEISTKHGTVVATAYHPFWVLEGHDLANRPRPRKLADTEDEGLALRGRWVNSHDLMAGDLIYSTEGRELRVLKIVQTYEEQFEVCNLTIAQNHSFAVGNDGVLVHNTGGCGDAARVGGLGYPGSMPGVSKKTTTGPIATAKPGKNFISINHIQGAFGEFDLKRAVQNIPDEVILRANRTITDNGPDLVSFSQRTGKVTFWDSKYSIGRTNSSGVRVRLKVKESSTFVNARTLNRAVNMAREAILNSPLPDADKIRAIQSLDLGTYRTVTRGSGNTANSFVN